jgi:hypothetical protein
MDNNALKDILDLQEYLKILGDDRPRLSVILKELAINSETMQNTVRATALNAAITIPPVAIDIVNHLFKLGVTIGYKYAIKNLMEKEFGDGAN